MSTPERLSVLVVDDDVGVLEEARNYFESEECDVTTAGTAEEASRYGGQRFDVAILDGLEGEFFQLYEELDAGRKIILSGSQRVVNRAKAGGWEAYEKHTINFGLQLARLIGK